MIDLQKNDFRVFANGYFEQQKDGFKPRKDTPAIKISPPLDWAMDPLQDRNWRFQLSAWRMLPPIWQQFYGKDWENLQCEVLRWIRDWHRFHFVEQRRSAFMWQDMATGIRAEHLALVQRLIHKGLFTLSPSDSRMLDSLIASHADKLMDPAFISSGNHAIFQLKGLRLLGIVRPDLEQLRGEEEYASRMMSSLLHAQFRPSGVHVENSPDYHNFALANFRYIRPALFPSIAEQMEEVLQRAENVAPWLTLPNGRAAPIGDTEKLGPMLLGAVHFDASAQAQNGSVLLMRDLSDGGYVVLRTTPETPPERELMIIVHGQAYVTSHAHADQLAFNLFYRGAPLFVDSGKYSYNNDAWRKYFLSDRAHNLVGLQGRAFGPHDTRLVGSCIDTARKDEDGRFIVEGEVWRGDEFRHRRRYTYDPEGMLIISDVIECNKDDLPVIYFHLAPGCVTTTEGREVVIQRHGIAVARVSVDKQEFAPHLTEGAVRPQIQGWISPEYSKRVSAPVLEFRASSLVSEWECKVELIEPNRPYVFSHLPELLRPSAKLPFEYVRTIARTVDIGGGEQEQRFVIEVIGYPLEAVTEPLIRALELSGYRARSKAGAPVGTRNVLRNQDGTELRVVVRPPEEYKTRLKGSTGSVYFALRSECAT